MPALNLAIYWEHFLPIILKSQSAGNFLELNLLGIFREYTPEIICCKNLILLKPNNDPNFNKFSSYLTGLIEGDGTIIIPKSERSFKGKLNYPSIQIVFHLKDLPFALLNQKNLKFGSLTRKKSVNAYILSINNKEGILYLVKLLNGNMRTPKFNSLFKLIEWLNNENPKLNIHKLSLSSKPLNEKAWFSGMIESDGHFSIRTTMTSKYPKIECKFELSKRQKDHLEYDNNVFITKIAEYLKNYLKKPEKQLKILNID